MRPWRQGSAGWRWRKRRGSSPHHLSGSRTDSVNERGLWRGGFNPERRLQRSAISVQPDLSGFVVPSPSALAVGIPVIH